MPTIKFTREKKTVDAPTGANLRKVAMQNGVQLYAGPHKYVNCFGFGQCGSCKVHITKGEENVSKQGLWEKTRMFLGPILFFARLGNEKRLRLACQTRVNGDIEVETTPPMNWHGDKFWS